jgi:hypothetical protein
MASFTKIPLTKQTTPLGKIFPEPPLKNLLKKIVAYVHEHRNSHPKVKLSWPLQKGAVEKSLLSWNFYESQENVVQAFLAFAIKNLGVLLQKNHMEWTDIIAKPRTKGSPIDIVLKTPFMTCFFWEEVKEYYQLFSYDKTAPKDLRAEFVTKILPRCSCLALCLDTAFFRLRSGMNNELASFEYFLEDLYHANNGLIIFSRQKLIQEKKSTLKTNDYSISFKANKDILKSSIYEALEPQAHLIQRNASFYEPTKTGCFDRLIDLLTKGQQYIENLEELYREEMNNTNSY